MQTHDDDPVGATLAASLGDEAARALLKRWHAGTPPDDALARADLPREELT